MFVYVMKNAAMPGLYKIGRSSFPERRVAELSGVTGVPLPFEIVHRVDCITPERALKVEAIAHRMLDGFRVNVGREFFELEHENFAAQAIIIADFAAKGFVFRSEVESLQEQLAQWYRPENGAHE